MWPEEDAEPFWNVRCRTLEIGSATDVAAIFAQLDVENYFESKLQQPRVWDDT